MVPVHYIFPYAILTACGVMSLSVAVILSKIIPKQASDEWMDGYKEGQTKPKTLSYLQQQECASSA